MLVEPTFDRVAHIANRLRPLDFTEVFSQRWDDDREKMADEYLKAATPAWVFSDNVTREPIYFCGMMAERPGCWGIFGMGTPLWPRVAREVTRTMKRIMVPTGPEIGHRFECVCLAEKESAIRWLVRLGAEVESTLVAYGRNGEDFKMLVWRFDHGRQERQERAEGRAEAATANYRRDGRDQQAVRSIRPGVL